jgi:hypothetical protein
VSGFRQVAFKEGKLLFTRQISLASNESADFIAGSIEQEVLNSLEYLKRLSLKDKDDLDLILIVSKEIKASLSKIKLKGNNIIILTPFEAANLLNYKELVKEEDKFGDLLISFNFSNNKPILPFIPPFVEKLRIFEFINKWIYVPFILIIPTLLIYVANTQYKTYNIGLEIEKSEQIKRTVEERYFQIQKATGNIEEGEKIKNIVNLYKLIAGSSASPLDIIKLFAKAKDKNVIVKSISWRLDNASADSSYQNGSPPIPGGLPVMGGGTPNQPNPSSSTTIFELEFYNNSEGYQQLFDNFDKFVHALQTAFIDYNIDYSRIAEKISFNEVNKIIPVQVTITGPKTTGAPLQ